jgi:WD40 repeat protein
MKKKNQKHPKEVPEIFAIHNSKDNAGISRRNFVGIGIGLGTGALLGAAGTKKLLARTQGGGKLSGDLCNKVTAHSSSIYSVSISQDGKLLASAGIDKKIKLWNLPEGDLWMTLDDGMVDIYCIAFSPDGTILAAGGTGSVIKLWRVADGTLLKTLTGHIGEIYSVAISPDGTLLASGCTDKTIKLWSLPDGKLINSLKGHTETVSSVAFNPDGTMLASGSFDATIKLWSLPDGDLLKTWDAHYACVSSVKFSPDGTMLASGSLDLTVKVWSLYGQGANLASANPDKIRPSSRPTDEFLTASLASFLMMHGAQSQKAETNKPNNALESEIVATNFEQKKVSESKLNGSAALIAGGIAAASLLAGCDKNPFAPDKGRKLKVGLLLTLEGHLYAVISVAFSPDGKMLASGGMDNAIKLWRVSDGTLLKTLSGHNYTVMSVTFCPDGTMLASDCVAGTLKLWNMPDGDPVWCLYDPALMSKTECKTVKQREKIMNNAICTCDLVCTCDTITISSGTTLPGEITCTCDTVSIGTSCSSCSSCSSCASCGYWHPN